MNGKPKTYRDILLKDAVTQEYINPLLAINTDAYKFEIGACRILYGECNLYSVQPDQDKCYNLKRILRILAQSHCDEYSGNFEPIENGKVVGAPLVLEALEDRFLGEVKQQSDNEKDAVNNYQYQQNTGNYNIVHIPNYETSHQYEEYTNPNSRWCITYNEQHWKSYNPDGSKKIYFALQDGFENIPCEEGPNFPLDEYGLSMLCIQIDENGNMTQCTSRWNHEGTHGNRVSNADQIMNTMEVSKVLGGSVFRLCPPYSSKELMQMGLIPFRIIPELLAQGKTIKWDGKRDCGLEDCVIVKYRNKFNIINKTTKKLLYNKWLKNVVATSKSIKIQREDGKYNFINNKGQIINEQWFSYTGFLMCGFILVKRDDGMSNFVDSHGKLISDNWWFVADYFHFVNLTKSRAMVKREDGKRNFIDETGNVISKQWWIAVSDFYSGFSRVLNDDCKDFYMDIDGHLYDKYKQPITESQSIAHNILKEEFLKIIYNKTK